MDMADKKIGQASEDGSAMRELINALKKEGFKTTPDNPFYAWINRQSCSEISTGKAETDKIYVTDIAIPKVAPFDIAFIEIHLDRDCFYLALTLCFHSVMEGLLEAEEFNEVMSKHDEIWMPQLVSLFQPVEMEFSLKWDTEYDCYIEDSLYGRLDSEESVLNICQEQVDLSGFIAHELSAFSVQEK